MLPIATEILKDWNLFVNEGKTEFMHVYLAMSGEKDEKGNVIAGNELWRKSITLVSAIPSYFIVILILVIHLVSMLCSREDITRRISLGYAAFNKYNKAWNNKIPLGKRLLLYNSSCWAAPKSVLEKLELSLSQYNF